MKRALFILNFCLTVATAAATNWYVSTRGSDGADGRSWATAQSSIMLGLDNCKAGDTLFIAEGLYYEGIVLKDGITIIGGCRHDNPSHKDVACYPGMTVLDGKGLNTRLITCEQDCQNPTLIENLVLQNARHHRRGGAALLRGKVTMRHCIIRGCSGEQAGGVLIEGEAPEASALSAVLEDCLIHNCTATGHYWPDAGGVANFNGTLLRCTIANNYGDRYGGIHSESSVFDCIMWGNRNEYGFVDPANYVSDESISGMSNADEGFEEHFFRRPWLSTDNEAPYGPHFRDPATFAGVPITPDEENIMLAADYSIGAPTHKIAAMPPATLRKDYPAQIITFPYDLHISDMVYRSADYTIPSFIAFLLSDTATLVPASQPYCVVANINGDPTSRMAFNWFTNEGINGGVVQLVRKANAAEKDFEQGDVLTVNANEQTTLPLHYAISTSGLLKTIGLDKHTAFRYVSHKAVATDLQPATAYSYRVGKNGAWSDIRQFRTAAKREKEFSFIYMTDSHIQNQEYIDDARRCAEAVARYERDARFCVFPGDFVDTGTANNSEWEWERWFEEALKPVLTLMPIVPTDGNHDDSPLLNYTYHFNTDTSFNLTSTVRPQFAGINYSFVYGDMLLIAFSEQDFWRGDYSYSTLTSTYLTDDLGCWFRRQIQLYKDTKWRLGLVHKNLFSGSDHQRDKETPLLRQTLLPVMKDCHIDLLMQGHDHTYEIIGPVDSDTRKPLLNDIHGQETVAIDSVSNLTGKRGGIYNVSRGTLYFIGATCGTKRYTPLTREQMEDSKHIHQVDNYFDLFTGMFGQPGAPSYTRVTVKKRHLLLESFKVLPDGTTELFNTIKIVK